MAEELDKISDKISDNIFNTIAKNMDSCFVANRFHNCDRYMELVLCVDPLHDLYSNYVYAAANHNKNMENGVFPDAGFDIFLPEDYGCKLESVNRINFQIKCSATMVCESGRRFCTGYYMYPRSSLSKSMLRLANSVGIIDSGYRGPLIGVFDCSVDNFLVYKCDKLVQICAPGLVPIYVRVVSDIAELGDTTARGEGGFGSTSSQTLRS